MRPAMCKIHNNYNYLSTIVFNRSKLKNHMYEAADKCSLRSSTVFCEVQLTTGTKDLHCVYFVSLHAVLFYFGIYHSYDV